MRERDNKQSQQFSCKIHEKTHNDIHMFSRLQLNLIESREKSCNKQREITRFRDRVLSAETRNLGRQMESLKALQISVSVVRTLQDLSVFQL